jgi:hypothetical protein
LGFLAHELCHGLSETADGCTRPTIGGALIVGQFHAQAP